jgi:hypothetical protein
VDEEEKHGNNDDDECVREGIAQGVGGRHEGV